MTGTLHEMQKQEHQFFIIVFTLKITRIYIFGILFLFFQRSQHFLIIKMKYQSYKYTSKNHVDFKIKVTKRDLPFHNNYLLHLAIIYILYCNCFCSFNWICLVVQRSDTEARRGNCSCKGHTNTGKWLFFNVRFVISQILLPKTFQ